MTEANATNISPSDAAEEPLTLDSMNRLKLMNCRTCGTMFALPLAVWIDRMHNEGNVYCICGHENRIEQNDPKNQGELTLIASQLLVDLTNSRQSEAELRKGVCVIPAAAQNPISDAEFTRRLRWLVTTAHRTDGARLVCSFCARSRNDAPHFRAHLKDSHRAEIAAMPATCFE